MAGRPPAVIVHNRVGPAPPPHEADVLVQADAVTEALANLGYNCRRLEAHLDLGALRDALGKARPAVVFNLVESLDGSDRLIHLVPALLEHLGQPFTGAPADAMYLTTNKLIAKAWLRAHGVSTPDWWHSGAQLPATGVEQRWIVKSVTEQASFGLDDAAVVAGLGAARQRMAVSRSRWGGGWYAEHFVDGREINVSLLAGPDGPRVLPPAEIEFRDFPAGRSRLVGYSAKWDESSFEYRNTVRRFLDEREERALVDALRETALRCWEIFGLRGYARVDFRIDAAGRRWVLEVNANPCLSPDAGFTAALAQAGLAFDEAVSRILADAWRPAGSADD